MTLDSWMVARLARELDALLAQARVSELRGGSQTLTITCHRRGGDLLLRASLEPQMPLAGVVSADAFANENGQGSWSGGVAALLRGSTIDAVHAVPNDRILYVDTSSRSAFGVPARHRIVLELEPRKANALVLHPASGDGWAIIAAAKQFESRDGGRALVVGDRYALPPPRPTKLDRAGFLAAVAANFERETRTFARLLGEYDPTCTPPLAREVVERVLEAAPEGELGVLLLDAWAALRTRVEAAAADVNAPVFVYRRGDEITACHVVPLSWAAGEAGQLPSVNAACAATLELGSRTRGAPVALALRKKLELMLTRCDAEVAGLRAAQERGAQAEELRRAGDAIYANLASIEGGAASFVALDGTRVVLDPLLSAAQNAASYFKRYKKARSGLERIEARLVQLRANKAFWEQLLWELDRAETEPSLRTAIYEDVAAAVGDKKSITRSKTAGARTRGQSRAQGRGTTRSESKPVDLLDGAVAYVGRSPKDNERLTFTVARPNDYWFHTRGAPGAHVILKLAHAGDAPSSEQITAAAALAAGASRAAAAAKVEVDYTQRKHVRRQSKGKPGLVWYTNFKTVLVAPQK